MNIKKNWITSAHRGFVDNTLKENSLAAYYNAHLNGADMIETDARFTSDGVLIVNHDPTVKGFNDKGEEVTYVVSETPAETVCSVILSKDDVWGIQRVPTLEQVLNLAYHTGLLVNIDLKSRYECAVPVAKTVLRSGMIGKVVYALNGSGMKGIETIMAIDPDARFIDYGLSFAQTVQNFAERGKRCFCYTADASDENVNAIRDYGCLLALISLNASNFESAICQKPDMCEFLHTSDFKAIENDYMKKVKLY